jgi:hypothetical protein
MKVIKLLFRFPQLILVFFLLGLLFIFESIVTVLTSPFIFVLQGIEWAIKQLLTLINYNYGENKRNV